MEKKELEKNREAWNEALVCHQNARNKSLHEGFKSPCFTTFTFEGDDILIQKLNEIGLENKVVGQLPCNNGRELLSLLNLGAEKGIGFDISDKAIDEANELKEISNLNVEFHRTNILDIDHRFNNSIDLIFISEGSLQWFSSLNDYFEIVSKLLKPGGKVLMHEAHPFRYFFEQLDCEKEEIELDDFISYFEKGPYSYTCGLDYVGGTNYDAMECCWYMHKFSDIINAIIENHLEIERIDEHNIELCANERIKDLKKFPLGYFLTCKKK